MEMRNIQKEENSRIDLGKETSKGNSRLSLNSNISNIKNKGLQLFDLLSSDDNSITINLDPRKQTVLKNKSKSMRIVEKLIPEIKNENNSSLNLDNDLLQTTTGEIPSLNNLNYFQENNQTPRNSYTSTNDNLGNLGNLIDNKLREMKNKMMSQLEDNKQMLEMKYDDHIDRIKRNVLQKANRIKQVFSQSENFSNSHSSFSTTPNKEYEYMRKYTFKNVEEKLDQIFDIHEKIESSLEKNFEIMGNFLDKFDFFQSNNLQNFVNDNADDILNSWIFSKINFEKINTVDLLENGKIPTILKNFIFQDTVNKFSMVSITKSKNYDFEKKLMYDNHLILEKLRFKHLDHSDFTKVFTQISSIEGIQFNKLREIFITDSRIESLAFNNFFPNTEKIIIRNSLLKVNFNNVSRNFSKLKNLNITKSNFSNISLNLMLEDFCQSSELLENLETLNLSNNKISQFDLSILSNESKKFYNLHVLILLKNKIFKFKPQNLTCLPKIRIINLSHNNFTFGRDFAELQERSRKLQLNNFISFNKNLFLMNDIKQTENYIEYLINNLQNFEFFLRNLDISYTFNLFNREKILDLYLNSNIQISLKKLNLSHSSLETKYVITFIKNNSGFINLRKLNLSNNLLDDTFFELYYKENFINLLENLEILNLTANNISEKSLTNLEVIIKNQKKLKAIKLNYNPIENGVIDYLNEFKTSEINLKIDDEAALSLINPDAGLNLNDFLENLYDIKKDFKIIFHKNLESYVTSRNTGFFTKKNRELSKIINFEV